MNFYSSSSPHKQNQNQVSLVLKLSIIKTQPLGHKKVHTHVHVITYNKKQSHDDLFACMMGHIAGPQTKEDCKNFKGIWHAQNFRSSELLSR
jgi:hypothetical protein